MTNEKRVLRELTNERRVLPDAAPEGGLAVHHRLGLQPSLKLFFLVIFFLIIFFLLTSDGEPGGDPGDPV